MVNGFERRDTVQDQNVPAATAPNDARRLQTGPIVGAPKQDFSQVGRTERTMAQVLRFGSAAFEVGAKKRQKEDVVAGAAAFARGQTLDELEASGASVSTLEGFNAAKTTKDIQRFQADMVADMPNLSGKTAAEVDTLMQDKFSELYERTPESQRELLTGLFSKTSATVAGIHATEHNAFVVQQNKDAISDAITASSASGEKLLASGLLQSIQKGTYPGLNREDSTQALVDTVVKSLQQGDEKVHKALMANPDAVLELNFNARQANAIKAAYTKYTADRSNEYNEEYINELTEFNTQVALDARDGVLMSPALYMENRRKMEDKYNRQVTSQLSATWSRKYTELAVTQDVSKARIAKEAEATYLYERAPDLLEDVTDYENFIASEIAAGRDVDISEAIETKRALYEAHGLSNQWDRHAQNSILQVWKNATKSQETKALAAYNKQVKEQAKVAARMDFIKTGNRDTLSQAEVNKALVENRQRIIKYYDELIQSNPEKREQLEHAKRTKIVDDINRIGMVDPALKKDLSVAMTGAWFDKQGTVTEPVAAVAELYWAMHQKNPKLAAKHLSSDASRALSDMVETGQGNVQLALTTVQAQFDTPTTEVVAEGLVKQALPDIEASIDDQFEGLHETWFGLDASSFVGAAITDDVQWRDVSRRDIEQLEAGVPYLKEQARQEAKRMLMRNPKMDPAMLVRMASKKVFSTYTPMGGTWVKTKKGMLSPIEQAGLSNVTSPNVMHTALLASVRKQIEIQQSDPTPGDWASGLSLDAWSIITAAAAENNPHVRIAEYLGMDTGQRGAMDEAIRGLPELHVTQLETGTGVLVTGTFRDGVPRQPLRILYSQMGADFKETYTK